MRLIGITGGVGAGKSSILEYIRVHYRCRIYLADEVAHEVKKPGQPCYQALVALLGQEILEENGEIHKGRMAEKIFQDASLLEQVNAIVHPAVQAYLLERIREAREDGGVELFFIEAALLIECGYRSIVDEMWYIYTREEVRRRRLEESRGYSEEKIDRIMSSQLTEKEFRSGSDFVIDNSGAPEESFRQIRAKLEGYTWQP
ncbi:MAG: dephospho-CoA kinase [Lachnospiraceae bacterium]|nr:dephospho-CoA kinase [Lachnospiraceae bacterium]